jgi:hypothetical protein
MRTSFNNNTGLGDLYIVHVGGNRNPSPSDMYQESVSTTQLGGNYPSLLNRINFNKVFKGDITIN